MMADVPPDPHAEPVRPHAVVGRLLTADQVAARWQVPTSQVYRLTREGIVPVVKLGRYYRYRLDAIERFEAGFEASGATTGTR